MSSWFCGPDDVVWKIDNDCWRGQMVKKYEVWERQTLAQTGVNGL